MFPFLSDCVVLGKHLLAVTPSQYVLLLLGCLIPLNVFHWQKSCFLICLHHWDNWGKGEHKMSPTAYKLLKHVVNNDKSWWQMTASEAQSMQPNLGAWWGKKKERTWLLELENWRSPYLVRFRIGVGESLHNQPRSKLTGKSFFKWSDKVLYHFCVLVLSLTYYLVGN